MSLETRLLTKSHLYSLLEIRKLNKGSVVKGLNKEINRVMATMEQDDVKVVQRMIDELEE